MRNILNLKKILTLLFIIFSKIIFAQTGIIDPNFNTIDQGFGVGDGPNNSVYDIDTLSDGKVLIAGSFFSYNGISTRGISRVNIDGSLDTNFKGLASGISTIAVQNDGKILIGGSFTQYGTTSRNRIARLNSDGSLDSTFNVGTGADNTVNKIIYLSSGKILVAGSFSKFNNISSKKYLIRLNSDGSIDYSFTSSPEHYVTSMALQSDGKIVIGGYFYKCSNISRNHIARLNSNGSLDSSFDPGTGTDSYYPVYAVAIQNDGKILAGGDFGLFNGKSSSHLVRLNPNGSQDTTFLIGTAANNTVQTICIQNDNKILIGGNFTNFNGTNTNRICRLNEDGSIDNNFNIGTGANGIINKIALRKDGKLLFGGSFTYYNSDPKNYLSLINSNGSVDNSFNPIGYGALGSVDLILTQADEKIILLGKFTAFNKVKVGNIVRINKDGSLDNTFSSGDGASSKIPNGNTINAAAIQQDGKIVIAGNIDSYNGTLVKKIARLNADGSLDSTFNSTCGDKIHALEIENDGHIMIAGDFLSYGDSTRRKIARLNSDGTLDPTFNSGSFTYGVGGSIYSLKVQPDGKYIAGGNFNYSINNKTAFNIIRFNHDGTIDSTFHPGTGTDGSVLTIALQPNNQILIGGWFTKFDGKNQMKIARLNPNGNLDSTFNPGSGPDATILAMALQNDGKILIIGGFTFYDGRSVTRIALLNNNGSLDTLFNSGTGPSSAINAIAIQNDNNILIGGYFTSFDGIGKNRIARILIETSTSIQQYAEPNKLVFYPNPSSGFITLIAEQTIESIEIYDSIGKRVLSITPNNNSSIHLDLSSLACDMYFIRVKSTEGMQVVKILIQK